MTSDKDEDGGRPRGILTTADRDYLLAADEYSRQASHNRRTEITKRTTNAILDFWLLADRLEDRTVEQIADNLSVDGEWHPIDPTPPEWHGRSSVFEGVDPTHVRAAPGGFHHAMVDAIALIYRLYGDELEWFEQLVEEGVRAGISRSRGGHWTVDVDIDAHRYATAELDDVIEKLEDGELWKLNDLERETVLFELAAQDALDGVLDVLREAAAAEREFENKSSRADDTFPEFRERLPIGREIAKLRDPIRLSGWRGS